MKKAFIIAVFPLFLCVAGASVLLLLISGGDADKPITTPCSEEQAATYYQVANETGVPWDLVILIDTFVADKTGQRDIEGNNALLTSLDFCQLQVDYYTLVEYEDEETGAIYVEWEFIRTEYIAGKEEILSALGLGEDVTLTQLWDAIDSYDSDYNTSTDERETQLWVVPEWRFKDVISTYYGHLFNEKDINDMIELYESKYLYYFYMEGSAGSEWINWNGWGDIELPPIVAGNVSRMDIVRIAVEIINAPYLLGGKSPYPGPPRSPLDCSGYVDWVYMQAFGETVSGNLGGTAIQMRRCEIIPESELKIGDLGFYYWPNDVPAGGYNHVGIYVGTIGGKNAFIHCGGPYWGYDDRRSGRVVVSINDQGAGNTVNTKNPLGGTFSCPPMNSSNFKIFARPQFEFIDDEESEETPE